MELGLKKNIVIYNPNNNFGGAEVLFCRVLSSKIFCNHNLIIICAANSRFKKYCMENNLNTVEYDYLSLIEKSDVIICTGQYFRKICRLDVNLCNKKIVICLLHPYEFPSIFQPGYFRFKNSKYSFINNAAEYLPIRKGWFDRLIKKSSIYFLCMDESIKRESISYSEIYLKDRLVKTLISINPILPMPSSNIFGKQKNKIYELNKFAYFGRIEDFKTNVVIKLIRDISKYDQNSVLHIIGDGADLSNVINYAKDHHLQLICHGFMENQAARNLIFEEISFCCAMGIAALDSASTGTATIIANPFDNKIEQNYNWIFNQCGYSLGCYITKRNEKFYSNFNSIMNSVKFLGKPDTFSLKHVIDFHGIENASKVFSDILDN